MDRQPTDRELQGGIVAYGVSNILTALLGGLPTATYSQNVGIVATNKVVNRWVFALTGGFLLLAGVVPKFSAVLTTIPQCVLGGATVAVFSTIAMTGMKLIAAEGITARNTTIVGLSAGAGRGHLPGLCGAGAVPRGRHHHLRQVAGGHCHADGGAVESGAAAGGKITKKETA